MARHDAPPANGAPWKLLLLRHAKSSWAEPGMLDHDRPLNARGRDAAARVGELLADTGLIPDLVLTSTARRAISTGELVCRACNYTGPAHALPELYLAEPQAYVDMLGKWCGQARQVLMIGHNPGIETLLSSLIGREEHMPTAALACLLVPEPGFSTVRIGTRLTLEQFWKARDLPD
ncbi:MAG: histidine phosphatase family protein [Polyangiaceae bacterium]|nr:histidine phosphatase family protein [Polyangiaceae bacterium]